MSEAKKCPKCSGEMEKRYVRGYARASVHLDKSDSFWLPDIAERVIAYVCQECDYIELYAERRK